MTEHEKLYKKGKDFSSWKDHVRKKCFTRIKSSREALIELRRSPGGASLAQQIVSEEWSDCLAERRNPRIQPKSLFRRNNEDQEIKIMEAIMEEIQAELEEEEAKMIKEIEAELLLEEQNFDHLLSNDVICPVCKTNILKIFDSTAISCPCGTSIQFSQEISAERLQTCIDSAISRHGERCSEILEFTFVDLDGASDVYALCRVCDAMEVLFSNV